MGSTGGCWGLRARSAPPQAVARCWERNHGRDCRQSWQARGASRRSSLTKITWKKTYAMSGNEALPTLFLYPAPSFAFLIRGVGGVTLTCLWASSLPLGTEIAVSLVPGKFLEMLCEEARSGPRACPPREGRLAGQSEVHAATRAVHPPQTAPCAAPRCYYSAGVAVVSL